MKNVHAEILRATGTVAACKVIDTRFRVLIHNTIRGAAGTAILNSELLFKRGMIG
jgi:aspartate-semialdehyde dehydrogenase